MRMYLLQRIGLCLVLMSMFTVALGASGQIAQAQSGDRCFNETPYCISGRMSEFWEQNGGLPVFGLPIGPQQEEIIEGRPLQVQWFERNRLELHPENAPPNDVLIGRLGDDELQRRGINWFEFPQSEPQEGCAFFSDTGQNVCGPFLTYWRSQGLEQDGQPGISESESLALFGLPISPLRVETLSDGETYTVQWFERARFEFHPQNPSPYNVQLGLLGREIVAGGDPPIEPQPQPQPTVPPTPDIDDIDISVFRTYTYPTGLFSISVPTNWTDRDESSDQVVLVGFVSPIYVSAMAVAVLDARRSVSSEELAVILQQSVQSGFSSLDNLTVGDPQIQSDGSVRITFTYTTDVEGVQVTLQGTGYARQDGTLVTTIWIVVPQSQAERLQSGIDTIINSYQIDPALWDR
ncbi:MAG: hypothetical protein HC837_14535 [Chloroflexaceae bacterium]|nr:hypothetical protein [Chloroflexaceae bacterium]